ISLLFCVPSGAQNNNSNKREMRGTWIATVENIDWPARVRENPEQQKRDMCAILDHVARNNMNCVAFQVRPTADALYQSAHEPWSHWLTGVQGKAPDYDPLEFLIEEADRRGIAVHVWINPYRVWLNDENFDPELKRTVYQRYEGWLAQYGKTHYFQPADDRSREHIVKVVADIVANYDIDAIHMDDYFYPYRIAGQEFPDEAYFRRDPRGFTKKDDWRRDNVDRVIHAISDTIRALKPWVEFGISPFGVWRNASRDPRGSATRAGQTNYDDLYADILKWEQQGWIDYVSPQLYWEIGFAVADYKVLAQWWNDNANGTLTYIGHALYRIDPKSSKPAWRTPMEIVRQIQLNRTHPNIQGSFLYSAKFLADETLRSALLKNVYQHRALWPENPRITPIEPASPGMPYRFYDGRNVRITWQPEMDNRRFVVYRFPADTPEPDFDDPANIVCVTGERAVVFPVDSPEELGRWRYFVSALSLTHHESAPVECTTP
ncbi:family 10 glycosylhydrolase, partial [Alistipes sp. OttesenSCG-928-L06]|nr:family 10 glycosylhydrolase [Alistipes sp. OttesenSCG-928-L06]